MGRSSRATVASPSGNPKGRDKGGREASLRITGKCSGSRKQPLTAEALGGIPERQESLLTGWDTSSPPITPCMRPSSPATLVRAQPQKLPSSRLSEAPGAAFTGVITPVPPPDFKELGSLVIKDPAEVYADREEHRSASKCPAAKGGDSTSASSIRRRPVPMGFLLGNASPPRLFTPPGRYGSRRLPAEGSGAVVPSLALSHSISTPMSKGHISPRRSKQGSYNPTPRGGSVEADGTHDAPSLAGALLEELEERMSELSEEFLEFLERMDRPDHPESGNAPINMPPEIAAAILDIGLAV